MQNHPVLVFEKPMKLKLYQIDAFADRVFEGNPAAVCPLDSWLSDDILQYIAAENNLSETAFFVASGDRFHIRWFTPVREVRLCGHATLATAYLLFNIMNCSQEVLQFESQSGTLTVRRDGQWLVMDFPAQPAQSCDVPPVIAQAIDVAPLLCLKGEDYLVVYQSEEEVRRAQPNMDLLKQLDLRGLAITARGNDHDFVCRFFAPNYGIDEDPVTGSAYTQLAPYWSSLLGKSVLHARQLSRRGGEVRCAMQGSRVEIAGKGRMYLEGTIHI